MPQSGVENIERRLAAILAMDVVGFSRMMGADEPGTLQRLKQVRAHITDPTIAESQGRIVKEMGDGLLVQFDSAVNAVQCAIDVQDKLRVINADAEEGEAMHMRMGINLGDVIVEGEDIYGDGVNIAARLEPLADIGGILVSASVYDSALNKVSAAFESLGEIGLKNIDHPVRVYRIDVEGAINLGTTISKSPSRTRRLWVLGGALVTSVAAALFMWGGALDRETAEPENVTPSYTQQKSTAPATLALKTSSVIERPVIVVLPFNNFSDDKEQEYFSDGLTEDLITDISKVSGVRVIARNSTFSYKGKSPDVRDVGREMGASHVVEGSVRKIGETVRINVQLINASDGNHMWAERFDRKLQDIFAIQDEVIKHIVSNLSLKLTPDEVRRIERRGTSNLKAYDLYMRGLQQESFFNKGAFVEAKRYYEEALEKDPNYAEALAHLAQIHTMNGQFGWVDDIKLADATALELAKQSVRLGPEVPFAHWALARIYARRSIGRYDQAIEGLLKVIELDPNYADAHAFLGQVYVLTGQAELALSSVEIAMRTNPNFPNWYNYTKGFALFFLGNYDAATESIEKAVEANPAIIFYRTALAASYALGGNLGDAQWQIDELQSMGFDFSLDRFVKETPIQHPPYLEKYRRALSLAGLE